MNHEQATAVSALDDLHREIDQFEFLLQKGSVLSRRCARELEFFHNQHSAIGK